MSDQCPKTKYPDGIQKMDDYVGCIVKLKTDIRVANQRLSLRRARQCLKKGTTYIVHSHWRGKLTLAHRDDTLRGANAIAARHVSRDRVEVIAWRLA